MTGFYIGFFLCLCWALAGFAWHVTRAVVSPWWKPSWAENILGGPLIWFFLALSWISKRRDRG